MEIREKTISEAYTRIMSTVLRHGDLVTIPGYGDTLEYWEPIMTHITNPADVGYIRDIPFTQNFLNAYAKELIDPTIGDDFAYTYAKRLMEYPGEIGWENQVNYMIDQLNNDHSTRRAVATLRVPSIDNYVVNQPCLTTIKCHIFDEQLDMTAYFRSHDVHLGFPANAYGLGRLQQYILDGLDADAVDLGQLIIISDSPHIYIDADRSTINTFRQLNYGC